MTDTETGDASYRDLSLWHDTAPGSLEPRGSLAADEQVDVAIVGAGYTGLWTAYYLKKHDPGVRVALVEAEIAGFGASGRNGGWCLGTLAGFEQHLKGASDREAAIRLQRAMFETVGEVAQVCEREGIDCHWKKGGSVSVATAEAHCDLLREELEQWWSLGFGEEDLHWLEPQECADHVRTRCNLGGLFLAHCAAMNPLRLARGLAEAVERQGVAVYERSPALSLEPGCVVTRHGRLRAETMVRATEGYTGSLAGQARVLLPIHSMMIATEPLPESVWKEIGLANRQTFADPRRIVIYGQRTADDRVAFGCRGAYYYGSTTRDRFSPGDTVFREVQATLEDLFPVLKGHDITHRWGGPLGVPRTWRPAVGLDRRAGLAWAGGYVGEGVAASNLAGRTLADLILERDTDRVQLPLVGPEFRRFEPEPLRWLAVTATRRLGDSLDAAEFAGRPAPRLRGAVYDALVRK
jgi:glycine/D-amino acid oxidase-like deaminating enzyme